MAGRARFSVPLVALVAALCTGRAARAGDPPPPAMGDPAPAPGMGDPAMGEPGMGDAGKPADGKPGPAKPVLVLVSDAEAVPLVAALGKAMRSRTVMDAAPALDAIAGKTHPDFEPALARLLAHTAPDVAVRAAHEIGLRAGPKSGAVLARGFSLEINGKRPLVQGAILEAMGAAGATLDAKQFDAVAKLWKDETSPDDVAVSIAHYFEAIKTDKRPCRWLSEILDEPNPPTVIDAASPPASYWEAKWRRYRAVRPAAVLALHAITGQDLETTDLARKWFHDHEKEFGFHW